MTKGEIYYISNQVNEWESEIRGYFATLDDAKEALKDCQDWYRPMGTGRIFCIKFGIDKNPRKVFESR